MTHCDGRRGGAAESDGDEGYEELERRHLVLTEARMRAPGRRRSVRFKLEVRSLALLDSSRQSYLLRLSCGRWSAGVVDVAGVLSREPGPKDRRRGEKERRGRRMDLIARPYDGSADRQSNQLLLLS